MRETMEDGTPPWYRQPTLSRRFRHHPADQLREVCDARWGRFFTIHSVPSRQVAFQRVELRRRPLCGFSERVCS
jgi:hypothetical protein